MSLSDESPDIGTLELAWKVKKSTLKVSFLTFCVDVSLTFCVGQAMSFQIIWLNFVRLNHWDNFWRHPISSILIGKCHFETKFRTCINMTTPYYLWSYWSLAAPIFPSPVIVLVILQGNHKKYCSVPHPHLLQHISWGFSGNHKKTVAAEIWGWLGGGVGVRLAYCNFFTFQDPTNFHPVFDLTGFCCPLNIFLEI